MARISRILSRPTAKPYRTAHVRHEQTPYLDKNGHVEFALDDVENPRNWSMARRGYISGCTVLLSMNATFASSSPSGCFESIMDHFNVSVTAAGLTITLFLLGFAFGPLAFAPLSEHYGRRYVFYISFVTYILFNFLCAFAPNFASLLVGRFLTGTFVSAPLSNAPGVLADLWDPIERGNAMAIFSCFIWIGPALGPVISGFLNLTMDWRWSFYVLLWLGVATAVLMFTIPETYGPIVLLHKAQRIRKAKIPGFENVRAPLEDTDRSLVGVYKIALVRPWIILFDTISFLCNIYISLVYLLLYMLFSLYPIIYQQKLGWNTGIGSLPLLGIIVGALLGSLIVLLDTRRQARILHTRPLRPEDRLATAMLGGVLFAACMFWLAWAGEFVTRVHWIVPVLAGVFLSTAMMLIFVSYLNYLVDTYLVYAASALAANTVLRSLIGAAAPLFANPLFRSLGVGGGGSLVGGLACLLAVIPFAFYRWGERIRVRSRFAPTVGEGEGVGGGDGDDEEKQQDGRGDTGDPGCRRRGGGSESEGEGENEGRKDDDMGRDPVGDAADEEIYLEKEVDIRAS